MKNIYLYGASDDCCEIETDFDNGFEAYGDIQINEVRAHYYFDGDWGIQLKGKIPRTWKVMAIEANAPDGFRGVNFSGQFIHIQVPDDEEITYKDLSNQGDENT